MGWISDLLADIAGGDYLFVAALALLVSYSVWRIYWIAFRRGQTAPFKRFSGLTCQIGITLMFERLYEFSRAHVAVNQLAPLAYSNGYRLVDFEIAHGFFFEQGLEHFFLHDSLIMKAVYGIYAFGHLFVTLGFLIWMYVRRNDSFAFARNMFYLTTGVALILYMTFPTSPPRLFTNLGFVDPAQLLGITPAGGADATSQTYNPYAAFPSLHMVYALIVGVSLVMLGRHLWLRLAGGIYPLVMLFVVLVSANHWILDVVGSVVVVAGSALILWLVDRLIKKVTPLVPLLF